jgi:hypothetical protein
MSDDIPKWDNGIESPEGELVSKLDFTRPIFSVEFYFQNDVQHVMVNADGQDEAVILSAKILRSRNIQPMNVSQIIVIPLEVLSHGDEGRDSGSDEEAAGRRSSGEGDSIE